MKPLMHDTNIKVSTPNSRHFKKPHSFNRYQNDSPADFEKETQLHHKIPQDTSTYVVESNDNSIIENYPLIDPVLHLAIAKQSPYNGHILKDSVYEVGTTIIR